MMNVLRWMMDWPAPLLFVCIGSLGVLLPTALLDGDPDPYARYFGDPFSDSIWFGTAPGLLLLVVGILRLRMTLRCGRQAECHPE